MAKGPATDLPKSPIVSSPESGVFDTLHFCAAAGQQSERPAASGSGASLGQVLPQTLCIQSNTPVFQRSGSPYAAYCAHGGGHPPIPEIRPQRQTAGMDDDLS